MDGFASVHQLLSVIGRNLNLAGRTEFSSVPEGVVKVRDGFKVLRLEEVRPQNEKFVLALLCLLP